MADQPDQIVRRVHMPPPPATAVEMYLAAILEEIRAIRAQLQPGVPQGADAPSDTVELREPENGTAAPAPKRRKYRS